jgi:hypothetical protein
MATMREATTSTVYPNLDHGVARMCKRDSRADCFASLEK